MRGENLKKWINDNPWIKNGEIYDKILFTDTFMDYLISYPTIDIDNLTVDNNTLVNLINVLYEWKIYEPYPIQIYIFLINYTLKFNCTLKFGDGIKIVDKVINHDFNSYIFCAFINYLINQSNSVELLLYSIDNNVININQLLWGSIEYNNYINVKILLEHGANMCSFTYEYKRMIDTKQFDLLKLILSYQLNDVNMIDVNYYLFYHIFICQHRLELIKLILDSKYSQIYMDKLEKVYLNTTDDIIKLLQPYKNKNRNVIL